MAFASPQRRVLAALTVLASISFAACSSNSGTSASSSESSTPSGPVQITYMHRLPDKEGMTTVQQLTEEWNKAHPDIQVTSVKYDGAAQDMIKKIETDVKAGTAPCLAQVGYGEVPEVYSKGLLADVTTEAEKYQDNYAAGAYGQMKVGDKVVGLPQDTGPLVYFYNEKEFEALGLKVPTTMDEFVATAKEAAAKGKYIADFATDEATYWLSAQAAAAGDTWFSADNDQWKVTTTGAGSQKVASYWQTMLDDKSVLTEQRWGDGFTKALVDGTLIGTIGAAWEAGLLPDSFKGTSYVGQWRVAQLPDFGNGAASGPDGGSGVAVVSGCQYPAQAMEFNNWLNTQLDALASQGLVVAAKGTVKTPDAISEMFGGQDVYAELAKANEAMNPNFAYVPGFSAVGAEMVKAAEAAANGSGKVADVFTTAQDATIKTLKDAQIPVAE